jgi:hypothetical protein
MVDPRQRELAETVFERSQRREKEINNALKQEHARREAAVKNMYRLRALRLARDARPIGVAWVINRDAHAAKSALEARARSAPHSLETELT